MKKESTKILILIAGSVSYGFLMAFHFYAGLFITFVLAVWLVHWSNQQRKEFERSDIAEKYKNKLEGKPIIEQLKSQETWDKVQDAFSRHDPTSDKAKAIQNDVFGTLGTVPTIIFTIILIVSFFLAFLLFRLF